MIVVWLRTTAWTVPQQHRPRNIRSEWDSRKYPFDPHNVVNFAMTRFYPPSGNPTDHITWEQLEPCDNDTPSGSKEPSSTQ